MTKKKIVALVIALFELFFVGIQTSNKVGLNNTVQAAKKTKYDKLVPYVIPKRFRGTWHSGKTWIKFTKRRIITDRVNRPTYKYTPLVPPKHIWVIHPHGKEIDVSFPYTDSTGYYRKGKYLIAEMWGYKSRYHR